MCLPYWDSDLDIEVGYWASSNREQRVLAAAGLHSGLLRRLSGYVLAMQSELLYLCGSSLGIAGSMIWEESVLTRHPVPELSPLTLVFGYSAGMEKICAEFAAHERHLKAGVTECTFRYGEMPLSRYKVIVIMATLPSLDEKHVLKRLCAFMASPSCRNDLIPYYADCFGFVKAPLEYETDDPDQILMLETLMNFQLDETRAILGPSPSVELPALYELSAALSQSRV